MFQLNAFVTFSCFFLTKTHISVKEILLKSIKGGKNPWFFHDTSFIFTRRNSHERIQNKFLTKIYSGKCWHILSFGSHSEKLAQFFNNMDNFKSLAIQNLRGLFWFSIETWQARRGVIREKSLDFSEYWMNSEVFHNL